MMTELDNVTSSYNATSRDQAEPLVAILVVKAIVRYVFPVVIVVGTVSVAFFYYLLTAVDIHALK